MNLEDFEYFYQTRKSEIENNPSAPVRLFSLINLYDTLKNESDSELNKSYMIEISSLLSDSVQNLPENYIIPLNHAENVRALLKSLIKELNGSWGNRVRKSLIRFNMSVLRSALNVNDYCTAWNLVYEINTIMTQTSKEPVLPEPSPLQSEISSFNDFFTYVESQRIDSSILTMLNKHSGFLNEEKDSTINQTYFLTALRNIPAYLPVNPGDLEELSITIRDNVANDSVTIANRTAESGEILYLVALDALEAARNISVKAAKENYFTIHLSITDKLSVFTGASLGLAISALVFSQISRKTNIRKYPVVNKSVVFTGGVSASGRIVPVEDKTLSAKIETAFFSHIKTVVVPDENLPKAEQMAGVLKNEYPGKEFNLIGILRFDELLNNPKVFTWKQQDPFKMFAKKVRKIRNVVLPVFLVVISFIVLLSVNNPLRSRVFKDNTPVKHELLENSILIKNRDNLTLCDITNTEPHEMLDVYTQYYDINKNGKQEIFIAPLYKNRPRNVLFCYDLDGNEIWQSSIGKKIVYNNPIYNATEENFSIYPTKNTFLRYEDLDGDGISEIILLANRQPYFPYVIYVFDRNGKILGSYHNSGGINAVYFFDLNKDGIKEIFIGGSYTETKSAFFAVLPLNGLDGAAPTFDNSPCKPVNLPSGNQIVYVLFHKTEISKMSSAPISYVNNFEIRAECIEVTVKEYGKNRNKGCILYNFDYELNLKNLLLDDGYKQIYNNFMKQNIIKQLSLQKHKNNLLRSVRYFSDNKWLPFTLK